MAEVKALDAGDRILLSGAQAADVESALQSYLERGAKVISRPTQVGKSWIAACTIPPRTMTLEDSQALHLAEASASGAGKAAEPEDGCRVEELGFKRIVYGPSLVAVQRRVEEMKHFGAELIGEIEEVEGEWVAVCDFGGAQNTGYRW